MNLNRILIIVLTLMFITSCQDFVEVDPPRTELVRETVFEDNITAEAAVFDFYFTLRTTGFANGSLISVSFLGSLLSDEGIHYNSSFVTDLDQMNANSLQADNELVWILWEHFYQVIYRINAVLEGVENSTKLSPEVATRLTGEAKFLRAFCYFYMVNLWGDVPLVLKTDYQINKSIQRTESDLVYNQIVADLIDAESRLTNEYPDAGRVRANKGAASALLARVYLFLEVWDLAELKATEVIDNNTQYELSDDLREVFRTTSREAILQLWSDVYPEEIFYYNMWTPTPSSAVLRQSFVDSFEAGDNRWVMWGGTEVSADQQFHFVRKYIDPSVPANDFSTIMRLPEQYLIRAEARARQGKLAESTDDVNFIRRRAGLPDKEESTLDRLIESILQERRSEYFTEWGHRWFDLKRLDMLGPVLSEVKGEWNPRNELLPIPEKQLVLGPMGQNPGY